nr:hypothetical protein [Candidatus Pantoea persica]
MKWRTPGCRWEEDERGKLRANEQQCEQTVMTQFQQED